MINWLGPILYEYSAASEGGGNFFITSQEWLEKPGSVGRLDPMFGTRIVGDGGEDVAVGEIGQIYFPHSQIAPFEYFNDRSKTAAAELPGGAHFTVGDMGYVDEDGYLFLTGRSSECIISGGVNIYPQEIDNELVKHAAVRDACTVGIPNDEWGEEVRAVVALHPGYAPVRRSWPGSCSISFDRASRATRCRAASTSPTTSPAPKPARCSVARCARPIGPDAPSRSDPRQTPDTGKERRT